MKLNVYIFLSVILLASCNDTPKKEERNASIGNNEKAVQPDTTNEYFDSASSPETTPNRTDENGLKQGKWETYKNGKLVKKEFYKDGNLHGKSVLIRADGVVEETQYKDGLRDGYYLHYEPNSTSSKFLTRWVRGNQIWSAFPELIEKDFVPVKGFIYHGDDTIKIVVPYNSGKTMSVGSIVKGGKPVGMHSIYYESQELKAIVDYDNNTIKKFDRNGHLIESRPLEGMELIHSD